MLQTSRAEKRGEKKKKKKKKGGHLSNFHVFFLSLWSLNCLKKCKFCNFVLTTARNLCLFKQFTYMCLKGLVKFFQKTVFFIVLWVTVPKILEFKVKEFC